MQTFSLKPTAAATIPALALFLLFQACGGGGNAAAQQSPDPIEGVWEAAVTVRDCASGNVLATFRGSQMFHHGGTLSDTNSVPTITRGPGFGTWALNGAVYTGKFRFYTYDNAGVPTGTARVTRSFTLSPDAKTSTSTNTIVFEDVNGAVLRTVCGSDVGSRAL
mgnify:CR=1 FL=1